MAVFLSISYLSEGDVRMAQTDRFVKIKRGTNYPPGCAWTATFSAAALGTAARRRVTHSHMRLHCSALLNSLLGPGQFPVRRRRIPCSALREFVREMADIQGKRGQWMASDAPKIEKFPVNSLLTGKMSAETR
jgi:hypothetical protein